MNWIEQIAVMAHIKSEIAKADERKIWPYALPRLAADPARVASVEAHLGFALDADYRNFLLHADGWPAFYQSVDLFGTPELMGNERMQQALRGLSYIEPIVMTEARVTTAELLPI